MKITEVLRSVETGDQVSISEIDGKRIDWVDLDWHQLSKHVLRLSSTEGKDLAIAFDDGGTLAAGDVLYEDDEVIVVVRTRPEEAFILKPKDMNQMGLLAFELGNRHAPCIVEDEKIYIRYDYTFEPFFNKLGVAFEKIEYRFREPFKYGGHHDTDDKSHDHSKSHSHVHNHVHEHPHTHEEDKSSYEHTHEHGHHHEHPHGHTHEHDHDHAENIEHCHDHENCHEHNHEGM